MRYTKEQRRAILKESGLLMLQVLRLAVVIVGLAILVK